MRLRIRFYSLLIILIMLPLPCMAYSEVNLYGVTIYLKSNEILNGYIETDWTLNTCKENKNQQTTWEAYLKMKHDDLRSGNTSIDTIRFISKVRQIKFDRYIYKKFITISWFVAAKSSFKEIKIEAINKIEGVCRKWDGLFRDFRVEPITDYMADYISDHKMIASYTINFEEEVPPNSKEYAYGMNAVYLSYNPEYPRKRLIKERKIIDKMSDEILDKNKLIRFKYADD